MGVHCDTASQLVAITEGAAMPATPTMLLGVFCSHARAELRTLFESEAAPSTKFPGQKVSNG
jgi:hypothetical protein